MRRGWLWAHTCWLGHALGAAGNPLRRGADRLVAWLTVALVVAGLLAVPFAATWASMSYEWELAVAAREAASRHEVQAVATGPVELREAASGPHSAQPEQIWALVSWQGRDGSPRSEPVEVGVNTVAGARVPLWVDDQDRVTGPPRTADQVVVSAWTNGVAGWLVLVTGCAALIALVRWAAEAAASRNWEREWDVVEPTWTRRLQ
ncbi:Rv1733c family protein [Saccharopolyspora taberi]